MRTLGWQILDWGFEYLPSPADDDEPLVLTEEQAQIVLDWFEVDDRGEFSFRRGGLRMAKGWGKSPLLAFIALAELAGPVLFDHFAEEGEVSEWGYEFSPGEPVGRTWGTKGDPKPWVQIAACSEDQTENTYEAINDFLTANDNRAATRLGIDWGKGRLELVRPRRGKLNKVTAAAGSREGQRVTFAVLDETHLWTDSNGGVKLAKTLRRNVAKMGGRSFETTNSYDPSENSVAQKTQDAVESGGDEDDDGDIFYYAVEAPLLAESCTDEELLDALTVAYGDSSWVPLTRLVKDARDPDMGWVDVIRYFLNINHKGEGKAIDPMKWRALADRREVEAGEQVGLGFDGSRTRDSCALIGCTKDGHLFEIAAWDRPKKAGKDWAVPRSEVHDAVAGAFATYRVGRMFCDPPLWDSEIAAWADLYRDDNAKGDDAERVLAFPTNQDTRMAPACRRFSTAVEEGVLTHADTEALTAHILAMDKRKSRAKDDDDDGRTRYTFDKSDTRKIDRGIAAVLAYEAAMTMPELPDPVPAASAPPSPTDEGVFRPKERLKL